VKCCERCLVHTFVGYVAQQLYDESWAFDGSVVLAGDVGWEQMTDGGHSPPYSVCVEGVLDCQEKRQIVFQVSGDEELLPYAFSTILA